MRNNQFKRKIRKLIEEECQIQDLQCLYVDISNDSRTFYIYTLDWQVIMTINVWMSKEGIHLTVSRNKNRAVALGNVEEDMRVSYMEFNRIVSTIEHLLEIPAD